MPTRCGVVKFSSCSLDPGGLLDVWEQTGVDIKAARNPAVSEENSRFYFSVGIVCLFLALGRMHLFFLLARSFFVYSSGHLFIPYRATFLIWRSSLAETPLKSQGIDGNQKKHQITDTKFEKKTRSMQSFDSAKNYFLVREGEWGHSEERPERCAVVQLQGRCLIVFVYRDLDRMFFHQSLCFRQTIQAWFTDGHSNQYVST